MTAIFFFFEQLFSLSRELHEIFHEDSKQQEKYLSGGDDYQAIRGSNTEGGGGGEDELGRRTLVSESRRHSDP